MRSWFASWWRRMFPRSFRDLVPAGAILDPRWQYHPADQPVPLRGRECLLERRKYRM